MMLTRPDDYLIPPVIHSFTDGSSRQGQEEYQSRREAARIASFEASVREDALVAAMNPPAARQVEIRELRSPFLPADYSARSTLFE
jgi:hypothetical protein